MIRQKQVSIVIAAIVIATGSSAFAAVFSNSNRANVLRQLHPVTGVNGVTGVISGFGVETGVNSNDGSGFPDQWQVPVGAGAQTGTTTFTLPGERTVGSFRADFNGQHIPTGGFQLQGLVGGVWTTLTTVPTVGGSISGSFTPTTVNALRYVVTGPGTNDKYIQNAELQVFLSTGQTIDHTAGYNIMRDVVNTAATTNSVTGGPWLIRTSAGSGNATVDGDYFGGHIHSGSTTPTNRSFFTLSFTAPTDIFSGNLGWYSGQQWNNWEIYSSNAVSMPATQSLTAADPATIQAAGWRLEYAGTGFQQSDWFRFNNTGGFTHRHLFVVWNGGGALNEFELFVPEPASAMLLGFGGLMMLRRRQHC